MKAPQLHSDRLIFKPLSLEHCTQRYVNWLNDPEVYRFLESGGNYSLSALEQFLAGVERQQILFWAIHIKSDGKHIGNIKIDPINKRHGLGEYGILMGDKTEWGKGYAYEASKSIIDYCFSKAVNLRKMTLGVVKDNVAAVKVYKKLGFVIEGEYVRHFNDNGHYRDSLRMALFNSYYDASR